MPAPYRTARTGARPAAPAGGCGRCWRCGSGCWPDRTGRGPPPGGRGPGRRPRCPRGHPGSDGPRCPTATRLPRARRRRAGDHSCASGRPTWRYPGKWCPKNAKRQRYRAAASGSLYAWGRGVQFLSGVLESGPRRTPRHAPRSQRKPCKLKRTFVPFAPILASFAVRFGAKKNRQEFPPCRFSVSPRKGPGYFRRSSWPRSPSSPRSRTPPGTWGGRCGSRCSRRAPTHRRSSGASCRWSAGWRRCWC